MSASATLAKYGFTMTQAFNWIAQNVHNPSAIFNAAKAVGLSNEMLREIVAINIPSITTDLVRAYFQQAGLNPTELDASNPAQTQQRVDVLATIKQTLLSYDYIPFPFQINFDGAGGAKDFLIDLANFGRYIADLPPDYRMYAPSALGAGEFRINNFGADDRLTVTGDFVAASSHNSRNVDVLVTGPLHGNITVKLVGVNPNMNPIIDVDGAYGFNRLPVGDIYFV